MIKTLSSKEAGGKPENVNVFKLKFNQKSGPIEDSKIESPLLI